MLETHEDSLLPSSLRVTSTLQPSCEASALEDAEENDLDRIPPDLAEPGAASAIDASKHAMLHLLAPVRLSGAALPQPACSKRRSRWYATQ